MFNKAAVSRKVKKNIIYSILLLLIIMIFIELSGLFTYFLVFHERYSKKEIKKQLKAHIRLPSHVLEMRISEGFGDLWWADQVEVLHPYFGFSRDPDRNAGMTPHGFPSYHKEQICEKSFDELNIAVFGGSFAKEVYFLSNEQLKKCFSSGNRKVQIFNFSIGGYKQPQQLMVLNYLLAIGAQFDVVINIDGFNEVALPYVENVQHGVSPYYPRNWIHRAKGISDPLILGLIGKIEILKDGKRDWANLFKRLKLYRSPSLSLIWRFGDNRLNSSISDTRLRLKSILHEEQGFKVQGPEYKLISMENMYKDLADIWMRSSLSMHFLCKTRNIKYFHFLQPNQYVPGSKILSFKEKKIAYLHDHPYKEGVEKGYPELRKRGRILMENNVHFFDLTDIFRENDTTFYKDTCCHLNEQGYQIIVEKMCEAIHSR